MPADKNNDQDKESGRSCGRHSCCGSYKVIGAIVLIMLGWICGFLMGSGGGMCAKKKMMCGPKDAMSCPMTGADSGMPSK